ncbi:SGNH/GDSL hydrolase family protein [Sphingomonas solaris]|uniref:SGNH/GDSL hydrolase family protein n=1 Tax=Alterirhizorhabdus solaris TaxID=2529389 RepID=A0A558R1W1_9SPHN|nr:SGNH/GDSL hydrolase family protein [Sphingomonas solaris]TVV73381.1 SGNH/GDSL hydrolase family protein [Sphingomonas solaris]
MIGLALAAAASLTAAGCGDTLCNARVLDPFFAKLATATDRTRGHRPVHILQIGDSHTAGDTITGGWRDILQARYGSGGRGVMPPGGPYQGYLTRWVTAEMSPGWRVASIFGAGSAPPRPMMGVAGFSITSTTPGARIALTADANEVFDRFTVCAAAGPDSGALTILIGGRLERMTLDAPGTRAECKTITTDQPQSRVELVAADRPVTITSWATFRDSGGVALSNVGVVGSQLVHFSRNDDAVLAEEMRSYKPDLIVLAFGTNEGFAPVFRPQEYEITLRTQISRLRRGAGNVPILLFGAPDALTRRRELLSNAPVATPAPCVEPLVAQPVAAPRPVSPPVVVAAQSPAGNGVAGVMASLRAAGDVPADGAAAPTPPPAAAPVATPAPAPVPVATPRYAVRADPLFPPAGLGAVRDVQRRVAASLNLAFWDWEARMGGRCAAVGFVKGAVPLMRGDYVHFNSAGGREIATRLQADLDRAMAARR